MWLNEPPTPSQCAAHAARHPYTTYADGRVAALWLLRPKPRPTGWTTMSRAERHRSYWSSLGVGDHAVIVATCESVRNAGEWGFFVPDRGGTNASGATLQRLQGYEWCPLSARYDPVDL